ncbi:Beta-galactosidase BoGH2A [Pontiella desulfatans]|uniref:Beta-galactosidase BoGH2A n=1 Tax=Pontiella desulfatans TaxID=2750659 RepID=A0A6C2TXU1_PONDE|nr:glycoside hydrolase family 2 TIM barrel-domain containing protein [Pontiella desulfatans]VGO12548.1 Beta-galactosidase BoGH2A [Pontiella desulfatans]
MKRLLVIGLLCCAGVCSAERMLFDDDWKFIQKDVPKAEQVQHPDAGWRTLDLPHDWTVEGSFDPKNPTTDRCGYLPTGIAWYRKTIEVPKAWKGKQVAIEFDGVFRNSTVWANGKKLGHRPYGWISFGYDVSDIVNESGSITFAVRVDNQQQHAARWYTGSGIYAHTWINIREPIHIPTSGIWIRTKGSTVSIDAEVVNKASGAEKAVVKTTVRDAEGNPVAMKEFPLLVKSGETATALQTLDIPDPNRWSPESPYLYTAVSEVVVDSKITDRVETRFGVRDIEWIPGKGMVLNGKLVKLRGVCQHQHGGAFGAAVPEKIIRFRVEQMKAMGCNSIRTAHNPHTPEFYDICDELGIIVMDEFVDGWNQKARADYGAQAFADWWKQDLTDWIKRDRNHPSVFVWSIGNETHGEESAKAMLARCHEIDPTRPVTSGSSEEQLMDIVGMNGGSESPNWFETQMPNDRVFIGTENTHTWQTRGYYRTQTWYRDGITSEVTEIPNLTEEEVFTVDWTDNAHRANRKHFYKSSYDNATVRSPARRMIAQIRDIPNNAGMYRWTGHDYLGEAGLASGAWPFKLFSGGTCDLANFEKDLYYLYQSQWTTEPMVHILPHWTHPAMKPGTEIPVWVYSNCDEVELFLNGKSQGKQTPGTKWQEMQCQWMVGWTPGSVVAVGYDGGRKAAEKMIRTADEPAQLQLSVDGEPLAASGKDLVQVRTTFRDAKGEFYPYGENRVFFNVQGPAKIKALDNGKPNDVEPFHGTTDRMAFFGLARAYIESGKDDGAVALVAGAILGDKKLVVSSTVHIDVQQIALRGKQAFQTPEIFFTTDGSTPSVKSTRYNGGFEVALGTTVKALVMIGGQPALVMEERFADDVGLLWEGGGLDTEFGGDQAEDAEFQGATKSTEGRNYNGSGFLDMGKKTGAYVEWYRENDGDTTKVDLIIRHSGAAKGRTPLKVRLNVNGQMMEQVVSLPPSANWGRQWRTVSVPITLKRGANTIRLTTVDAQGLFLDEIEIGN